MAKSNMPQQNTEMPKCGLVMPISAMDGCSEQHWAEVQSILTETLEMAGFSAVLVSSADEVGVIQRRIIQNLYENPIVVCDVSGKNPNVMFELGLRLAFDKPTIIIKDDKTSYSFDTGPIEHLEYPRDLRFSRIIEFKQNLIEKVSATHKKANSDPNFSTFLKHFGEFSVSKLETGKVSKEDYIIEELVSLKRLLVRDSIDRDIGYRRVKMPSSRGGMATDILRSVRRHVAIQGYPPKTKWSDVSSEVLRSAALAIGYDQSVTSSNEFEVLVREAFDHAMRVKISQEPEVFN